MFNVNFLLKLVTRLINFNYKLNLVILYFSNEILRCCKIFLLWTRMCEGDMLAWFLKFRKCEYSGSFINFFTTSQDRVCITIITFLIYRNAEKSHLWHFLRSTVYLKYVDWRHRILVVCRGSGEVASRGMKELLSGWKLRLPSERREAIGTNGELFSTRRRVNNRCTTNICSVFYSFFA